jgi:hypothetical protein
VIFSEICSSEILIKGEAKGLEYIYLYSILYDAVTH